MAMSLTRSIADTQNPQFYAEMDELISSSGQVSFAATPQSLWTNGYRSIWWTSASRAWMN